MSCGIFIQKQILKKENESDFFSTFADEICDVS